jgi:hypothetical protein
MRVVLLSLVLVCCVSSVLSFELNSLNTIEYTEGETILLSTKVLDKAIAVSDTNCSVYVLRDDDQSVILNTVDMWYNEVEEHYEYFWVPELTWWENIEQIWNPAVGNYHAYVVCNGGSLTRQLIDVIAVQVVVG